MRPISCQPARGGSAGRRSYVGALLPGRGGVERHRRGPFFVPNPNTNEGTWLWS